MNKLEQTNKFILLIGLNDKDTKKQEIDTQDAIKTVTNVVGDNTMQIVQGHYTHEDGSKVDETTLKVELLFKEESDVRMYCKNLKSLLNQESIAVSKEINMSALF